MTCRNIADWFLYRLTRLVVNESHHAVNAEQFQIFLNLTVVYVLVYLLQQPRFKVGIFGGSRGQEPLTHVSFCVVECQTKPRFARRLSVAINQAGILALSPRIGENHIC